MVLLVNILRRDGHLLFRYAMMSGGDVVPLGKDAVTELHAIFNWAERSSQVRCCRSRYDP